MKSDGDECDSKSFASAIPIDCLSSTFLSELLRLRAMPNRVISIVAVLSVSVSSSHASSCRH